MDFLSDDFIKQFTYHGPLGLEYGPGESYFYIWAPLAERVVLRIFPSFDGPHCTVQMDYQKAEKGSWIAQVNGDLQGQYYTVETWHQGKTLGQACDPYARAVGPNGQRTYIFDPSKTQPAGWDQDISPEFHHVCDAIIYELHVRDLSSLPSSGIQNKGKFLGLAETGTRSNEGQSTGLDHVADLGVTHVHLLPVYDFDDMGDIEYHSEDYNWGYNPRNFNALKGAYSSNPTKPSQGVEDFKIAVSALHKKGLRVVLDVVYNHTFATLDSNLNKVFPDYYYRKYGDVFSNGSGCGNELATERPMVRRYIIDSLKYLAQEFHLDGFRFDLMGLYDVETINQICTQLRSKDPNFLLYGEGWTGGLSTLPDDQKALKANASKVREVAFFSDDTRDAIKGHVFDVGVKGFVNGGEGREDSIKFAVVANTYHPQINYDNLLYSHQAWAAGPHQTVGYAAAHDNHTLWDKLIHTNPHDNPLEIIKMHKLAHGIVLTSQGLVFIHAGEEFLRNKKGVENSYRSPDSINGIDWTLKHKNYEVFAYYRGLIQLRKAHPALRLRSQEQIKNHIRFLDLCETKMLAFVIQGHAGGDPSRKILVIYNANTRSRDVHLPWDDWSIIANHEKAGNKSLGKPKNHMVTLPGRSLMVLATDIPD